MEYCNIIKQKRLIALRHAYCVNSVQGWWSGSGNNAPLLDFPVAPKTCLILSFNPLAKPK